MIQNLTFDDGTVCDKSHALQDNNVLYVYLGGITLSDAYAILSDSNKTHKIVYRYYKAKRILVGYTKLVAIRDEGAFISAILRKDEDNDGE